jgi:hypothetical protein
MLVTSFLKSFCEIFTSIASLILDYLMGKAFINTQIAVNLDDLTEDQLFLELEFGHKLSISHETGWFDKREHQIIKQRNDS